MIWLIGARGMLGRRLRRVWRARGLATACSGSEVDIASPAALESFLRGLAQPPRWIVNAAAYTAVDRAESEREAAFRVNAMGPGHVARLASACGARLIHFSTDYVFSGDSAAPYTEDDPPSPRSVYGESKLAGEAAVLERGGEHVVLRISWLYDAHAANFVATMLRRFAAQGGARVVDDQRGSPTWAGLLAENVADLVDRGGPGGLYHYCDRGVISWYEFAAAVAEEALAAGLLPRKAQVEPIPTAAYPTAARRPVFSALECRKVEQALGFRRRPWRENLRLCLAEQARPLQEEP